MKENMEFFFLLISISGFHGGGEGMEATVAEQEFSSIIYHDPPLLMGEGGMGVLQKKKMCAWREERLEGDGFVVVALYFFSLNMH